jgi:hypothetical protein
MIGLFIWFIVLFKQTVNREKYNIVNSVLRRDLNLDTDSLVLNRTNFDMAFSPFYVKPDFPESKKQRIHEYIVFGISYSQFRLVTDPEERKKLGGVGFEYKLTQIPLVKCTSDRFLNMTKAAASLGITGQYWCPDPSFVFNITGTWSSSDLSYITLSAAICDDVKDLYKLNYKCAPRNESVNIT